MADAWGWAEPAGAQETSPNPTEPSGPGLLVTWLYQPYSKWLSVGNLFEIQSLFLLLIVRVPRPSVWCLKGLFDTDHHIEMAFCSWGGQGRESGHGAGAA